MKRYAKILFSLFLGLITVEILSAVQIHRSMLHLAGAVMDVIRGGYLITVPNALLHAGLYKTSLAVYGGLFFTLTIGALVSTVSLGAAFLLLLFPERLKILLALFGAFLLFVMISVNQNGFLPLESLSLILAPILVCGSVYLFFRKDVPVFSLKPVLIHGMPPVMLAFILVFFVLNGKGDLFSDFRDAFLLSNPVGMKINDFYYRYTMAPAEVFKSQAQKLLKTCVFEPGAEAEKIRETIEPRFLAKDYAVLDSCTDPDLLVRCTGDSLAFIRKDRVIVKKSVIEFMANSSDVLKEFSKKTDRYAGYRPLIKTALQTGLPLLMYILIHAVFFFLSRLFMPGHKAVMAASFAVPLIGLVSFTILYASSSEPVTGSNLSDHLSSSSLTQRVAGLKYIESKIGRASCRERVS
jgi:hypothetical protein